MGRAAAGISKVGGVGTTPWESLKVSGKVIIDTIFQAIRNSDVAVFEVTDLNENVMFELGFAIGAEVPVWLLRDPTIHQGLFPKMEPGQDTHDGRAQGIPELRRRRSGIHFRTSRSRQTFDLPRINRPGASRAANGFSSLPC